MTDLSIAAAIPSHNTLTELAERYYGNDGNRKPDVYLVEYEKLFGSMRNLPIRILELGVKFGASMFLWSDYFPNATIVGLDIGDKPKDFPASNRVHFVQGSQDDPVAMDKCAAIAAGQFDIIVDDASHIGRLSAASFSHLFPRHLAPSGYYVIEDICTAFLPEFPDSEPFAPANVGTDLRRFWPRRERWRHFPSHQTGMVGIVKQLFDHVMAPTVQGRYSAYAAERMLILTNIAIIQKAIQ
jgi:cephalosporin hydroxylase